MTKVKYSRQRESILTYLAGRKDHPSAEQIYRDIRISDPKISLGTIYRNLALLAETGQIRQFPAGDGKVHYDWNTAPHSHFLCRKCGAIRDVDGPAQQDLLGRAPQGVPGYIEEVRIQFCGVCEECAKRETAAPAAFT